MSYETLLVESRGPVGLITLNRPKALNAINARLIEELLAALAVLDADDRLGAIVLTGGERAFAAGADIKEMQARDFGDATATRFIDPWSRIAATRKPLIAAVSGVALGGGCEIAMMCDIILAAEGAKFGQPEIKLGVIPGGGGTQRLTRAIGKSKAMMLILTGDPIDAQTAERWGLVARVVPAADLLSEALALAGKIAALSQPVVAMAKEAVNRAEETALAEGLLFERRQFYACFALADRAEGMAAFVEKRPAKFAHR
ncbi:MAG: enoyl-CoA hydratase [Alphaproteobacteria bacterium]|nr:enoyl-CoA hydratase [Alphaproteobacteria bacterium]